MELGIEGVLASGQDVAESRMRSVCTVERLSHGVDEDGYDIEIPTVVYGPDIAPGFGKCRVRTYAPQVDESVSVGSPVNRGRYVVSFPVGTDVRDGDIVRVEGRRLPLYLRGDHDMTDQTAVRMQAATDANSDG